MPIWRTDYLFRGVEVPAGKHAVRFEFRPLSFRIGLVISVLAWLAGLGLFCQADKLVEGAVVSQ